MTSRLQIYNGALLLCEERFLSSLTEDREPRHLLDHVWNNGGVRYCLEQGQWRFAMRSVSLDYDTSVVPDLMNWNASSIVASFTRWGTTLLS